MYSRYIIAVPTHIEHILILVLKIPKEQGVLAFKETGDRLNYFPSFPAGNSHRINGYPGFPCLCQKTDQKIALFA